MHEINNEMCVLSAWNKYKNNVDAAFFEYRTRNISRHVYLYRMNTAWREFERVVKGIVQAYYNGENENA